jgi:hypothetical protein
MLFEWDGDGRGANHMRHKLDLIEWQILFDGRAGLANRDRSQPLIRPGAERDAACAV